MAEYKRPENPHSFKKGSTWYLVGVAVMAGGLMALLHGNSEINQNLGYDEGVDDGTVALASRLSSDTIHEIKDEQNDDEEESP